VSLLAMTANAAVIALVSFLSQQLAQANTW